MDCLDECKCNRDCAGTNDDCVNDCKCDWDCFFDYNDLNDCEIDDYEDRIASAKFSYHYHNLFFTLTPKYITNIIKNKKI